MLHPEVFSGRAPQKLGNLAGLGMEQLRTRPKRGVSQHRLYNYGGGFLEWTPPPYLPNLPASILSNCWGTRTWVCVVFAVPR